MAEPGCAFQSRLPEVTLYAHTPSAPQSANTRAVATTSTPVAPANLY